MITVLGRLLENGHPGHPQAVLEGARAPGRSIGSLARALEGFFIARPKSFAAFMLRARERVPRAGTMPRKDETIETALATVRDLAQFMDRHLGKRDWALAGVYDIEAFLPPCPRAASSG
jgi:hypothetical protein